MKSAKIVRKVPRFGPEVNFFIKTPYARIMNLLPFYKTYSNEKLIRIIDMPDGYTEEAKRVALTVLESRKLIESAKHELARMAWEDYCQTHFKQIVNDSVRLKSQFLKEDEINQIMNDAYNFHKDRQELFEIDLSKYWGAAFF